METWLPVQLGGNARWKFHSTRDEIAQTSTGGGTSASGGREPAPAQVAVFPVIPDDQLWTFQRLVLNTISESSATVIRFFQDDVRTALSTASEEKPRQLGGKWNCLPLEVFADPFPIQVPGGSRLGVTWSRTSDGVKVAGIARAQIVCYERA